MLTLSSVAILRRTGACVGQKGQSLEDLDSLRCNLEDSSGSTIHRRKQQQQISSPMSKAQLIGKVQVRPILPGNLATKQLTSHEDYYSYDMQAKLLPKNKCSYFELIQAVGTRGKYQTAVIILAYVINIQNGLISLGIPYFFAVAPYTNCPAPFQGVAQCTQFVCSLPPSERQQYEQPQIAELVTLGNEFGDYHCDKADELESVKGIFFLGGIIGFLIGSYMADNIGRRTSLILSQGLGVVGTLEVFWGGGLGSVSIGMFLIGFCMLNSFNVIVIVLSQILQNDGRQKVIMLVQIFVPVGGIYIVLAFRILKHWRVIFLYSCLLPLLFSLIFTYLFLQETPQLLIKCYPEEKIRQSLRFIAGMNGQLQSFQGKEALLFTYIHWLKREEIKQEAIAKTSKLTYADLFRFKSLRRLSICTSLVFMSTNILYYAPLMLIDQFGFDFYVNGLLINFSELITYTVAYHYVTSIKRRQFILTASVIIFLCALSLIFLHTPSIHPEHCWAPQVLLELALIFLMRIFVSFIFQLLYVYTPELYPVQVVGLGMGLASIAGNLPDIFIPEAVNLLERSGFPMMGLFCVFSCLNFWGSFMLEETFGRAPQDKVSQLTEPSSGMGFGREEIQLLVTS